MKEGQIRTVAFTGCGLLILGIGVYFGIVKNPEINTTLTPSPEGTGAGARSSETATNTTPSNANTDNATQDPTSQFDSYYEPTNSIYSATDDPEGKGRKCNILNTSTYENPQTMFGLVRSVGTNPNDNDDTNSVSIYNQQRQNIDEIPGGVDAGSEYSIVSAGMIACPNN